MVHSVIALISTWCCVIIVQLYLTHDTLWFYQPKHHYTKKQINTTLTTLCYHTGQGVDDMIRFTTIQERGRGHWYYKHPLNITAFCQTPKSRDVIYIESGIEPNSMKEVSPVIVSNTPDDDFPAFASAGPFSALLALELSDSWSTLAPFSALLMGASSPFADFTLNTLVAAVFKRWRSGLVIHKETINRI